MATEFLRRYGAQHLLRTGPTFAPDAIRALHQHAWPGNVRELQNRVQRAVIMADGKRVTTRATSSWETGRRLSNSDTSRGARAVERELVQDSLRRHGGKITPAALELGISRPKFYELMEKLGIAKE